MSNITYSIKDLENITQIKAHTIRIWEQRYSLLTPRRTETNIRFYNEEDLKKILNINLLYTSGKKISKIAALSDDEILEEAKGLILNKVNEQQSEIDSLIYHILHYNGKDIKAILDNLYEKRPLDEMYQFFIIPVLQKIGQLWQVNSLSITQEHYFSNIIRNFFISKIYALKKVTTSDLKAMLFLHDREEHEFSLLFNHYMLKKKGVQCYYFGTKTPLKEIEEVYEVIQPDIVITAFVSQLSDSEFDKIQDKLIKFAANSQVLISGGQLKNLTIKPSSKLIVIETIDQFKEFINSL